MTALWLADEGLILASGSETRRTMLAGAGVPVDVIRPDVDERAVEDDLPASRRDGAGVALALAEAKSLDVSRRNPSRLVLGADQTLLCEGQPFHKPADREDATAQLAALSGREHVLISAFCLARDGAVVGSGHAIARLHMRRLSPAFIEAYLAAAVPAALSSVGGYQVEALGAQLFETIEGDHFTILGLPLLLVLKGLRDLGCLAS